MNSIKKEKGKEDLTVEKLRTFKGFEKVSDEEAEQIIHSVKELSVIICQHYLNTKKSEL